MKKRIIAFILVAVMSVLCLAGCGYSFRKDDMDKYVDFDSAKFDAALLDGSILIKDGAFGYTETNRWVKVDDAIYALLVTEAGTTNFVNSGTPDKYAVYYYCYYVTHTDDNGNVTVYEAAKMNDSSATKLGLGMSTLEGLDADIAALVAGKELTASNVYSTSSTKLVKSGDTVIVSYYRTAEGVEGATPELVVDKITLNAENTQWNQLIGKNVGNELDVQISYDKVENAGTADEKTVHYNLSGVTVRKIDTSATQKTKAGDTVYVTYKKTYTAKSAEAPKIDDESYTYIELTLDENNPFHKALIDKNVNTTIDVSNTDGSLNHTDANGNEYTVAYSSVKVNWIVNSGEELGTVEYTPDEKLELTPINSTTKVDLKGKKLVYHIYPTYYIPVVSSYDAKVIVDTILGTTVPVAEDTDEDGEISEDEKKGTIDAFLNESYKNGEELAKDIVKKYVELKTELDTIKTRTESSEDGIGLDKAWEAYYNAEVAVLGATTPTDAQKATVTDTKRAYEKVKAEYDKKEGEVNAELNKLLTAGDIATEIVSDYKQLKYDTLEEEYLTEIKKNLSTEIYALAKKYMTFKTDDNGAIVLPEKYVDDVYDRLINDYKYDFYTGSTTVDSETVKYYDKFDGDFNAFLMEEMDCKEGDTVQTAKDLVRADAREEVKTLVIVYKLAEHLAVELDDEDWEKIDTIIQNLELNEYYYYQLYTQWGITYSMKEVDEDAERDVEHAVLSNKLFNYILEKKEVENSTDAPLTFERVVYGFKADEAVTE